MIGYRVPPNVSFEHGIAPRGQRVLTGMTSAQILFSLSRRCSIGADRGIRIAETLVDRQLNLGD